MWAPPTHLPPPPLLSRPANRSVRDPPPPFTVGETEARGSRRCLRPCPCLLPSPGHWDQCLRKGLRSLICGCGLSINKGGQSSAVAVLGLWGSWGVCVTHGAFQCPPPQAPSASCRPRLRLRPAVPKPGAFLGKNVKAAESGRTWRTAATAPLCWGVVVRGGNGGVPRVTPGDNGVPTGVPGGWGWAFGTGQEEGGLRTG